MSGPAKTSQEVIGLSDPTASTTASESILGRGPSPVTIKALLKPHAGALSIALLAILGAGVCNLLQPWPLKIVFDVIDGSKPLHGWLKHLVHADLGHHKMAAVEFAALALIAIALLSALCSYAQSYITSSVGQWVMHDLRCAVYDHLQMLSLRYHKQREIGDLISRLTTDIEAVQNFVVAGSIGLVIDVITLIGMGCVMFYLNWRFTLIALSVSPLLFVMAYAFTRRSKKASRQVRRKQSEMVSMMQEDLSAIGVVKTFAREGDEQRRLAEESRESVDLALRARSLKALLSPLVEVVVAIGTALILWRGGQLVLAGTLSAGSLIVFIWYLGKMYKPMQDFAKMTDSYSKATVGYERILEILNATPDVQDRPGAQIAPRFSGRIAFERVSFSYIPGHETLAEIDFEIEAGQTVALVGPTGGGKTTIAGLIARLYDPDSGTVKIDAQDVKDFAQKSLRDQISFVIQDNILFRTTIRENIAYGKPGATLAEITRAAQLADAHEFIAKMPQGYDTLVGERGETLSGGQRQRIAIARAIVRNAPIFIMDEPSSGLDTASEKIVFEGLRQITRGKTVVVIAHRLATVENSDMIMVVDGGRIVETGKHKELLDQKGLYARLYDLQFREEPDPNEKLGEVMA